jgi:hypothetical protein
MRKPADAKADASKSGIFHREAAKNAKVSQRCSKSVGESL